MSISLSDFLLQEAEKYEAQAKQNQAVIEEWRDAVQQLFRQLRAWLSEADPKGIIKIHENEHEVTEPGLGRYKIPRLDFKAFGKWIGLLPKARYTVASAKPPQKTSPERADGRVDMTDEVRRYVLYWFRGGPGEDVWLIDDLRSEPKLLTKEGFEAALLSYLR